MASKMSALWKKAGTKAKMMVHANRVLMAVPHGIDSSTFLGYINPEIRFVFYFYLLDDLWILSYSPFLSLYCNMNVCTVYRAAVPLMHSVDESHSLALLAAVVTYMKVAYLWSMFLVCLLSSQHYLSSDPLCLLLCLFVPCYCSMIGWNDDYGCHVCNRIQAPANPL